MEHQDETPWQSLVARLAEVVRETRAWAARGAGSPASHLSADGRCRPLSLSVTPGQRADCTQFHPVLEKIRVPGPGLGRPRKKPDSLATDRGYSNGPIREYLRRRGIRHTVPEKTDSQAARLRKGARGGRPPGFNENRYKKRNAVERAINRLSSPGRSPLATSSAGTSSSAPPPRRPSQSGFGHELLRDPAVDALVFAPGAADESSQITHDRVGDLRADDLTVLRTQPSPRGGDVSQPGVPGVRECGGQAR